MKYRQLGRTGLQVSALSFGASSLGGVFRDIDEGEGIRAVHTALDEGINFIDVAPYYGETLAETVLGRALRGIPRDRYHLATKVGRYGAREFDFSPSRVIASVDESLARLGIDHIDLIQVHDIEFGSLEIIVEETLPALRELQRSGKVGLVGITGLPVGAFCRVARRAEVDTVLSYSRYCLNDTSLLGVLPELEERGVGVLTASPLSMGLLSHRGPPDWHPAPIELKEACARAAEHCSRRGADISKLAVQFSTSQERLASCIVGSADPENIRRNCRWIEEPLDEELLAEVRAIFESVKDLCWYEGLPENSD
jgi:aryl-alcohol dehydrogenase-like predicted oxidoreductase